MRVSQSVKGFLMRNLRHIILCEDKIMADFQICIGVPLSSKKPFQKEPSGTKL